MDRGDSVQYIFKSDVHLLEKAVAKSNLYDKLGVSHGKEEVHRAIKDLDKGLFPNAFCKILPDVWESSADKVSLMHADTAGTKTSLAYLYWRETGDYSVWKGIAQDALVMNLDDMGCVGAIQDILISSTIGRNKNLIDGKVIATLIESASEFVELMSSHGIRLHMAGGETADVGDIVRTIDVGYTTTTRMARADVLENSIIPELNIVALASYGQCTYESRYNSGIGSNGLTGARHQLLNTSHREKYPESCDPLLDPAVAYSGNFYITDETEVNGKTYSLRELLLSPTRTYLPFLKVLLEDRKGLHGIIHNTGGALGKVKKFAQNVRIIKDNLFDLPPVFQLLRDQGMMSFEEMHHVYNLGQRLEIYVTPDSTSRVLDIARDLGIEAQIIGHTEPSDTTEVIIKRGEESFAL